MSVKFKRIFVTGGAGFVGSNLACRLKESFSEASVVAFDNLRRRGSELTIPRLRSSGVDFLHGDVRIPADIFAAGEADLVVDCAAEPSVMAGIGGSGDYVVGTNLVGTANLLEAARQWSARVLFLSTSRVYPVGGLSSLEIVESETRFELAASQKVAGASREGISEQFSLDVSQPNGARTLYGATKLSSELLVAKYRETYNIPAIVNRCGVITGPWQMGKVDQGVVVLWLARHFFGKALTYIGYGGTGKQVRDILHIDDLASLVISQLQGFDLFDGLVLNVGGGREVSVSLRELTTLRQRITGSNVLVQSQLEGRPGDVPVYLSNCAKLKSLSGWTPRYGVESIVEDIARWIRDNREALSSILG